MASHSRLLRRPPAQRDYIATILRREIVEGRLRPGVKLPTYQELLQKYGTARATIHSAIGRLFAEGFIERRPRRGIFVAERPPHLFRYGMVFHDRPGPNYALTYFFQALMDEAKRDRSRKIDFFYVADPFHDRDREAYQDLLETVVNDCVAGLVFTFSPYMLRPTPVLQKLGVPRVGFMGAIDPLVPTLSPVHVDYVRWMARALDAVKARGCRRVALLATPGLIDLLPTEFERGVRDRGMTTRELWVQAVRPETGRWVGRVLRLMMDGPAERRPDAVLIADDNLLEHATAGLVESGLRSPRDVFVVAHSNFPNLAPSALPVQRLGFDVRAVLHACWDLIDLQRQGEPMPASPLLVPPIFENEFNPNAAPRVAARELSQATAV